MWVHFILSRCLRGTSFRSYSKWQKEAIFSTVPLGHAASVATSAGLSVDSACARCRHTISWMLCEDVGHGKTATATSVGVPYSSIPGLEACDNSSWGQITSCEMSQHIAIYSFNSYIYLEFKKLFFVSSGLHFVNIAISWRTKASYQ